MVLADDANDPFVCLQSSAQRLGEDKVPKRYVGSFFAEVRQRRLEHPVGLRETGGGAKVGVAEANGAAAESQFRVVGALLPLPGELLDGGAELLAQGRLRADILPARCALEPNAVLVELPHPVHGGVRRENIAGCLGHDDFLVQLLRDGKSLQAVVPEPAFNQQAIGPLFPHRVDDELCGRAGQVARANQSQLAAALVVELREALSSLQRVVLNVIIQPTLYLLEALLREEPFLGRPDVVLVNLVDAPVLVAKGFDVVHCAGCHELGLDWFRHLHKPLFIVIVRVGPRRRPGHLVGVVRRP
mmetsp:Transcript_88004/g.247315  ORF Transcript_88004/g.247315 Transcript_88004/m.247315 type:complete len:301 (+) Transcript_88004:744-1646(+)